MTDYTFYDPATGRIISNQSIERTSDLRGRTYIPGRYLSSKYYIQDRKPVKFPAWPIINGSAKYRWDWHTHAWILDAVASDRAARDFRQQLLLQVDRVNPIWYASLTAQQQTELQDYRQALLDITDQSGYPTEIDWPTQPAWL